jgi:hypothetical protein
MRLVTKRVNAVAAAAKTSWARGVRDRGERDPLAIGERGLGGARSHPSAIVAGVELVA